MNRHLPTLFVKPKFPSLSISGRHGAVPAKMAAPEVKELARETAGKALILKVNTEESPQLAAQFGVQSSPNFVVLREGRTVFQQAGLVPRAQMRRWLETAR
jgi:thioredoxin 2